MRLRVAAPAKINWTLEVLGKRDDGYHEIRSVLQTINLCDWLTLEPADGLSLEVHRGTRSFRRHSSETPDWNLAFRAARLLAQRCGVAAGARLGLHKHVPIAAGLGGGSSDAAAALRGLRSLWRLDLSDDDLMSMAAELGSDVPFFIVGGTALARGRGELIEPLPDIEQRHLLLMKPPSGVRGDKTAAMYASLRPDQYSDGSQTEQLVGRLRADGEIHDSDLRNVFESALTGVPAERFDGARSLGIGQPHLCGSGPAFFFLAPAEASLPSMVEATSPLRLNSVLPRTMPSAEATAIYESA
jgi:4-diphosphocytidyl-2-C-methyl-D-erythritol kinase